MNRNRPTFYKAWQAQVLASTAMLNSEMLSTFYAYQAYQYLFNDVELVNVGVLPSSNFDEIQ